MEKNQGSGYEQYDIMYITLKHAKQNNTLFINKYLCNHIKTCTRLINTKM